MQENNHDIIEKKNENNKEDETTKNNPNKKLNKTKETKKKEEATQNLTSDTNQSNKIEEEIVSKQTSELDTEEKLEDNKQEQKEENINEATQEALINCPFCSKQIPSIAKVCPYCGKHLVAKENKINLMNKKTIAAIVGGVIVIALFFLVPVLEKNSTYKKALNNIKNKSYDEAIEMFRSLEGYKESEEYIVYCDALKLYENGEIEKAISRFSTINNINDAKNYTQYLTGINNIQQNNYEPALEAFDKAGNFLDSKDLAKYCQGIVLFLNDDPSATEKLQEISDGSDIDEQYTKTAALVIRFIEAKKKFNNNDYSCVDEFTKIADEKNNFISSTARNYTSYIEGKNYYDQELFFSAYRSFKRSNNLLDASELAESCFQERPVSGIIYNNTTPSVSITIYDTSDDDDMFIKIYDSDDNLIETVYIRDGSSATARFQSGSTRMAIAKGSGDTWFGPNEAFGEEGTYQRLLLDGSKEYFNFPSGGSYSLSFNVSEGNVAHKSSNYGDF